MGTVRVTEWIIEPSWKSSVLMIFLGKHWNAAMYQPRDQWRGTLHSARESGFFSNVPYSISVVSTVMRSTLSINRCITSTRICGGMRLCTNKKSKYCIKRYLTHNLPFFFFQIQQQKNTCAHNNSHKAHANGIKKKKRTKYVSTKGMDPKFLRNQKFSKKYNSKPRSEC